jgi:hypothetical protein
MAKAIPSIRSWQVVDQVDGNLQMVIIAPSDLSHQDLNKLIQGGMKCTVLDRRSELVNKNVVDKDIEDGK